MNKKYFQKKATIVAAIILFVVASSVFYLFYLGNWHFAADSVPKLSEDGKWYDQRWQYRKPISLSSSNTVDNYPVKVSLHSQNFEFSKAKTDGSDLIFTDVDGVTPLSFWIESFDQTHELATIWVKIPEVQSNNKIYIYYGLADQNVKITSKSNGKNTFELFEDFSTDFPGVQDAGLSDYDYLVPESDHNLVIPAGQSGEWDEKMREIGNVLYQPDEPSGKKYLETYTGYRGSYSQTGTYVGLAFSTDGKNWTKLGKIIDRPLEDPYLIKVENTYYLFAEDKADVPFRDIRRFSSTDLVNWHDDGDVYLPQTEAWHNSDVSSPIVYFEKGKWFLFYEGRGKDTSVEGGKIGLAISSDGQNWQKFSDQPVAALGQAGEWDDAVMVTDDLIKDNGKYYLFYHGYSRDTDAFFMGMAVSSDLTHWSKYEKNPIIKGTDTAMVYKDSSIHFNIASKRGIGVFRPIVFVKNPPIGDFSLVNNNGFAAPNDTVGGFISIQGGRASLRSEWNLNASFALLSKKTFKNNFIVEVRQKCEVEGADFFSNLAIGAGEIKKINISSNGNYDNWTYSAPKEGYSWILATPALSRLYLNHNDKLTAISGNWPSGTTPADFHTYKLMYDSLGNLQAFIDENATPILQGKNVVQKNLEKQIYLARGMRVEGLNKSTTIDWIRVRPFVATEPVSTVGEEENSVVLLKMITPEDRSTVSSLRPQFSWTMTDSGHIVTKTELVLDDAIIAQLEPSIQSYTLLSDLSLGNHHWKINVKQGDKILAVSQIRTFSISDPAQSDNLVKNNGFADGLNGWRPIVYRNLLPGENNKGVAQAVTCLDGDGKTGRCLKLQKNSAVNVLAGQIVGKLDDNATYRLTARYLIISNGENERASINLYDSTAKKSHIQYGSMESGWQTLSIDVAVNSDHFGHDWTVWLYGRFVKNGYIIYDNISLVKL